MSTISDFVPGPSPWCLDGLQELISEYCSCVSGGGGDWGARGLEGDRERLSDFGFNMPEVWVW